MAKNTSKEIESILKPYNDDIKRHIAGLVKKSDADIKRYTGALSEDFQSRLSGALEIIMPKFDQIDELKKSVGKIQDTVDSHTQMIDTFMGDMIVVKTDVKSIKDSLKTKVNRKEFVAFERRSLA